MSTKEAGGVVLGTGKVAVVVPVEVPLQGAAPTLPLVPGGIPQAPPAPGPGTTCVLCGSRLPAPATEVIEFHGVEIHTVVWCPQAHMIRVE